jgi:hypothetical protein
MEARIGTIVGILLISIGIRGIIRAEVHIVKMGLHLYGADAYVLSMLEIIIASAFIYMCWRTGGQ